VSLRTIVSGAVGRAPIRREGMTGARPRAGDVGVGLSLSSMRALETALALTAIATAVLIGLGR
jgi:hypothetical protein